VVGAIQAKLIVPAKVTLRAVFPEILPEVAVMVAVPSPTAMARPPLLTVATDVLEGDPRGYILGGVVRIGSGGCKLLGVSCRYARIGSRYGYGSQVCRVHRKGRIPRDTSTPFAKSKVKMINSILSVNRIPNSLCGSGKH